MSFDIETSFLDVDVIEQGKWVPLGADFPGVEIFTRGISSEGAQEMKERLEREAPGNVRRAGGKLTDAAAGEIIMKVIAEKCVSDWRGLRMGGKDLPFKKATLESFFKEKRTSPIAAAIVQAVLAVDGTKVSAVDVEGAEKN